MAAGGRAKQSRTPGQPLSFVYLSHEPSVRIADTNVKSHDTDACWWTAQVLSCTSVRTAYTPAWKRDRGSTEVELVRPDEGDSLDLPRDEGLRDRVFEDLADLIHDDFNRCRRVCEGVSGRSPRVRNGEGAPSDQGVLRGFLSDGV